MSRKCATFQEGYKLHITSLKMLRVSHYFSPECHLVRQSWQLKTCTGRTKKKKRSPLFLDISRAENERQYKGILSVTDALSATANGTFPWASSIHPLCGPAPLRSVARFLFSRPTRERERERERESGTRWMPMSPCWPEWQMGWLYKLIPLAVGKHNTLPAS